MKNFSLKQGGKNLICSLVASGIAITSGGVTASAASKNKTVLESYSSTKNYDKIMDNPVEIMVPTKLKLQKGLPQWDYAFVTIDFSNKSMNPTELSFVVSGVNQINKKADVDKFAYVDGNEKSNKAFNVNNARKNSDFNTLMNYVSSKDKKNRETKDKMNLSKYAEFWLPVLGSYSYTDENGKKQVYNQTEYIWFYVPYSKLSNKIDLSKYAEYAYARYQDGSFDHVITWKELNNAKEKIKTK